VLCGGEERLISILHAGTETSPVKMLSPHHG
jgi:hypothetical protein